MGDFSDLIVYKKAFALAMDIFRISHTFPKEEIYGLTNQIRRSSRSVCSNISEGYRKRQYQPHFLSKLSDADMENTETQVWLAFALACNYIMPGITEALEDQTKEIGRLLSYMMRQPEKFGSKP